MEIVFYIAFIIATSNFMLTVFMKEGMILEFIYNYIINSNIHHLIKEMLLCVICRSSQISLWTAIILFFVGYLTFFQAVIMYLLTFLLVKIYMYID